jgi:predicted transposase YdaD
MAMHACNHQHLANLGYIVRFCLQRRERERERERKREGREEGREEEKKEGLPEINGHWNHPRRLFLGEACLGTGG